MPDLRLWAPTGPLTLRDAAIEVIGEGTGQVGLGLRALLGPADRRRAEDEELLGLGPDVLGPGPVPPADDDAIVHAALSPDLMPFLQPLSGPEDLPGFIAELATDQPTHPLLDARNWFTLRLGRMVPVPDGAAGTLEEGVHTVWHDDPDLLDPEPEGPVSDAVLDAIIDTGLPVVQVGPGPLLRFAAPGPHGDALGYVRCWEPEVRAAAYAQWHVPIPVERRAGVMEVVTRANAGLPLGNLEMDLDTGVVRAKCSGDLGQAPVDPDAVALLIVVASRLLDGYLPAIVAVQAGSMEPAEAVERAEAEAAADWAREQAEADADDPFDY